MAIPPELADSVELLVTKKIMSNNTEVVEKYYVKKDDLDKFVGDFLDTNPYFNGLKWLVYAVLTTFFLTLIGGSFAFFAKFASL